MRRKMRMATLGCTVAMAVFPASALADETAAHNEAVVQQIQEALVVENAAPTTPVEQFQRPASLAEGLSATEVEQLQEIADNAPATASTDVQLPSNGDGRVVVDSGESRVTLGVPGEGTADQVGGTTVFEGDKTATDVAVQATTGGARALVNIESEAAPERFNFPVGGDAARLEMTQEGGVTVYNAADETLGVIAPAWARDANGVAVPTHYEIDGTTLTQVVQHKGGNYAYGITADPWYTSVAKVLARCAGGAVGFQALEDMLRRGVTVKKAAKFVIRRAGLFAVTGCVIALGW